MSKETRLPNSSPVSLVLRLYWILGCNAALSMMVIGVAFGRIVVTFPTIALYVGILVSALIVRFVEIKFYHGETADNEPATLKDWKRYCVLMLLVFVAGFALAAGIQNLTM